MKSSIKISIIGISILSLFIATFLILENIQAQSTEKTMLSEDTIRIQTGLGEPIIDIQLLENTDNCFIDCYAILEFTPYQDIQLPSVQNSEFQWDFVKETPQMPGLLSHNFQILTNVSYDVSVPIYENVSFQTTCYNHDNSSYKCTKYRIEQTDSRIETRYRDEFRPFSFWGQTLESGKGYIIKVSGKKPAALGTNNVDWIPTIKGIQLSGWAWWNTSVTYRQPVWVNQTGSSTLTNFVFLLNGTEGVDTASLISSGYLDSDCRCMWLLSGAASPLPYKFENITSETYGCNTENTLIWGEIDSLSSSNETVYLYTDDSCGASSTNEQSFTYHKSLWLMGEEQGTTIVDTQGYNELTSNNASMWEEGKYGYATRGGGTTLANGTTQGNAYDGVSPFTVSFWYKFDDYDDNSYRVIWGQQESLTTNGPYSRFTTGQDYIFAASYENNTLYTMHSNRTSGLTDGEWYLFTYRITGDRISWWVCGGSEFPGCGTILEIPTSVLTAWNGYDEFFKLFGSDYSDQYIAGSLDSFSIMNTTVDWNWQIRQYHQEYSEMDEAWIETIVTAANEEEGDDAIGDGIAASGISSNSTTYTDQQIYIYYNDGVQDLDSFDKVVISGNQTWAFNYVTENETKTFMNNLTNIVYVWENENITETQIEDQVAAYIDETNV